MLSNHFKPVLWLLYCALWSDSVWMTRLWLNLLDADNVQVRPYSGRELDFCLLWLVNECCTEERHAAGVSCECSGSTPSQIISSENSLSACFHRTNVSFTYLNLFQSIYFACSGDWSMRGNAFLGIDEFSCENPTLSASSFSFYPPSSLLCCQSQLFFKEGGCEQGKIPQTNSREVKNALFKKPLFLHLFPATLASFISIVKVALSGVPLGVLTLGVYTTATICGEDVPSPWRAHEKRTKQKAE